MFINEYLRKGALEFDLSQYARINQIQYVNIKCAVEICRHAFDCIILLVYNAL